MTVTFRNLSGVREPLDKTIRAIFFNNWTKNNTKGITPKFESDTEEKDFVAREDGTGPNNVLVSWISRTRTDDPEQEALGDSIHLWQELVVVEIHAESLALLLLFEDEINRIIWENRPNSATRLNKANGSASHIEYFGNSEMTFERIEPDDEDDVIPKSTGDLVGFYYKNKT